MKKLFTLITFLTLSLSSLALSQEVAGRVTDVVVYRGQALVTRTIEAQLEPGGVELIVPNLPSGIISESLFAQSNGDFKVLSVRYREKTIKEDTRKEVKEIESEIEDINKRIYVAQRERDHGGRRYSAYHQLWQMALQTEQHDFDRALLQPQAVIDLTQYLEDKNVYWHSECVRLEQDKTQLEKELDVLKKKLEKLGSGRKKIHRHAIIFIDSKVSGPGKVSLSYMVRNANWLPQYNLRAKADDLKLLVEYNAVIHQSSGENWDGVRVSLSTAAPTTEAGAPILDPIRVNLGAGQKLRVLDKSMSSDLISGVAGDSKSGLVDLTENFRQIQFSRNEIARRGKGAQQELSQIAMQNSILELNVDKEGVRQMREQAARFARNEGVSVTYKLDGLLTMPSRSDQQMVTIAAFETDADFVYVATPLLTDYVYLQADASNSSATLLLAGPANMYRNGEFVGKGNMDMVPVGKTFTVGLGAESRIQVARELEDKEIDSFLGNQIEIYKYRISINNFNDHSVRLRLLDRMPYTQNEELAIKDFQTNVSLSDDSTYVRTQKDKGILRWDIDVKPQTFTDNATIVTYEYTMKYDNDLHVNVVR